ncbi:MAG: ATP-binding protein [Syntrophales bacterium]|nr:ATP-binding protein [Syntrophales bacterium]
METFVLAVLSFALAVKVLITRKLSGTMISFAILCFSISFFKINYFLYGISQHKLWFNLYLLGLFSIVPSFLLFVWYVTGYGSILSRRMLIFTALLGLIALSAAFIKSPWFPGHWYVYFYVFTVLCAGNIDMYYVLARKRDGVEKARLFYVSLFVSAALLVSLLDLIFLLGVAWPPISNFIVAALLYLIFSVITHPQLLELKELMARALVTAVLTLTVMTTFFCVVYLLDKVGSSYLTGVMLASFLIVIIIDPARYFFKKLLTMLFPESKDVFDFVYSFDSRLEQEKSLLLEEMAPVLAHEIRNPLGSIKAAAQYLRSESEKEEDQRLLDVIIEEVNRLNNVVTQFLYFAKPYTLNLKVQDVNTVVEKAVSIIRASPLAQGVVIEEDLRDGIPQISVDAEQLIRVILNIAFNALEAMGGKGRLTIRTRRINTNEGVSVGISIRDTGPGIPKEHIKNIFKPFFTTKERGVGLGLAICMRIVKGHGGHIRVKSIPGQGSIFYIRLNAQR